MEKNILASTVHAVYKTSKSKTITEEHECSQGLDVLEPHGDVSVLTLQLPPSLVLHQQTDS